MGKKTVLHRVNIEPSKAVQLLKPNPDRVSALVSVMSEDDRSAHIAYLSQNPHATREHGYPIRPGDGAFEYLGEKPLYAFSISNKLIGRSVETIDTDSQLTQEGE